MVQVTLALYKWLEMRRNAVATEAELREEIAKEILLMDCPSIQGEFVDSWHMFRYVRNKAIEIVNQGKPLYEKES